MNINKQQYINIDCMDMLKEIPDKHFDVAIVDPPYGHEKIGVDRTSRINGKVGVVKAGNYEVVDWNIPPSEEYFKELHRVSRNQIIWGFNFLREIMPVEYKSKGIIVWDKVNDRADQYPIEIAYQSFDDKPHLLRYMWRGMFQGKSIAEGHVQQGDKSKNEKRIHIMQKPVNIYRWILKEFKIPATYKILDTHVGSASSLIAFTENQNDYLGLEKNRDIYLKSKKRLDTYKNQISIFELEVIEYECKQTIKRSERNNKKGRI